jgi:membrane protease YdiL (CAAX protease family)
VRLERSLSIFGALGLVLLAALGTALVASVALGIEMLRHDSTLPVALAALQRDLLLLAVCQLGGLALAIGAGVIRVHGAEVRFRDALDVRPVPAAVALLTLTAGVALQFPLTELVNLLAQLVPGFAPDPEAQAALRRLVYVDSVGDAIVVPLAVVVIPALSEELFFRGLLQRGLTRRYGAGIGVGITSVLFGVVHAMPAAIVYASVAGLVLGLVRLRTGSVLPCIALHGAFNAVPILLPADVVRIDGFNTFAPDVYHLPIALTIGSAVVVMVCLWAMMRLTADLEESEE